MVWRPDMRCSQMSVTRFWWPEMINHLRPARSYTELHGTTLINFSTVSYLLIDVLENKANIEADLILN